ncbi:MAG: hypothetical protein ACR2QH_15240 [Geminicoccaceae bacterium]
MIKLQRADDYTPAMHHIVDRMEHATAALAEARTMEEYDTAFDRLVALRANYARHLLDLDKKRRPEFYKLTPAQAMRSCFDGHPLDRHSLGGRRVRCVGDDLGLHTDETEEKLMISSRFVTACRIIAYGQSQSPAPFKAINLGEGLRFKRHRAFEVILQLLVRYQFLASKKGPKGGYRLTEKGRKCSMYDLLKVTMPPSSIKLLPLFEGWKHRSPREMRELLDRNDGGSQRRDEERRATL